MDGLKLPDRDLGVDLGRVEPGMTERETLRHIEEAERRKRRIQERLRVCHQACP